MPLSYISSSNFPFISTDSEFLILTGIRWNTTFHNASHEACVYCIGESSGDTEKIIDNLMQKFHQDLVFCCSPADSELTIGVHRKLFSHDFVCSYVSLVF
jgi:hypothetical protein